MIFDGVCDVIKSQFLILKYDKLVKSRFLMANKKAPPNLKNWRGAQILSDDLYLAYHEEAKDEAQQRIWTFYEAINIAIKYK